VSTRIADYLTGQLEKGDFLLGQVRVSQEFQILHHDDAGLSGLTVFRNPHDVMEIVRYDDAGKYRPLKSAPNLRHGWRLDLAGVNEVQLALDFLYPAALGLIVASERDALAPVNLRDTLARQTGMYAVVKKISDQDAAQLIGDVCRGEPGCLRRILWDISPECRLPTGIAAASDTRKLLCAEACNLLVAAGRKVVKKSA